MSALRANLFLSVAVAATGICLPIALSFVLLKLAAATPLQAFAAGAALCSTSLGTTFTILKTSGLTKSRLGIVLTSAAMMDDVIGLVMVQIISDLRVGGPPIGTVTVVRPVFVSLAFAIVLPLCCRFVVLPSRRWLGPRQDKHFMRLLDRILGHRHAPFLLHTALLLAMVTGSSYAGTSNLFAAYLAGALVSWWDAVTAQPAPQRKLASALKTETKATKSGPPAKIIASNPVSLTPDVSKENEGPSPTGGSDVISAAPRTGGPCIMAADASCKSTPTASENHKAVARTGAMMYKHYYSEPVDKLLKPLFFVSFKPSD